MKLKSARLYEFCTQTLVSEKRKFNYGAISLRVTSLWWHDNQFVSMFVMENVA
ncbi:MAG: hypothetical protein LAT57_09105 [Balneolales bacterium]|nr:hypothetical protein [Balneolales bacterium]